VSPIACSLAALLMLEAAPAGPSECPLTDNRCKAERFVQRAATAASSAVRAKYLEAAHGSFLASYDTSGDVRDLCAARRTFDQTLAALDAEAVTPRLAPLKEALEKREQVRRPRCASGAGKAPKAPALASARQPAGASRLAAHHVLAQSPPSERTDELLPVPSERRILAATPVTEGQVLAAAPTATEGQVLAATPTTVAANGTAGLPAAMRAAPGSADRTRAARRLVIAGSVTMGFGLSLVGVAAYAGSQHIEARRAGLELFGEVQGYASAEQAARDGVLRDRYQTMGHLALGTSLAGGAAVIVGVTMAVVGGRRLTRLAQRMALGPLPGGLVFYARF
jgi:hypothetical protein